MSTAKIPVKQCFISFLLIFISYYTLAQAQFIITVQPTDQSVCTNSLATLTTAATGNNLITYQWQKLNAASGIYFNLTNASGYSGTTNSTLSINTSVTGIGGEGTYRCRIFDGAIGPLFTNDVTVTINSRPTAPTTTSAQSCGPSSLTLNASSPDKGQYEWYLLAVGGSDIKGETSSTYVTPVLNASTTYYVALNNGTCSSTRTAVTAEIIPLPAAPTTMGASACGPSAVTLTASGGNNGQYRWYTQLQGGTAIPSANNGTYTTPVINTTTTYFVAINNGTCESARSRVTAQINTVPSAPGTTGNYSCKPTAQITLSASGGTTGQYRWYTTLTGGTALSGQTNATFTTPLLSASTTYYVALNNGVCEGDRSAVLADIRPVPKPSITASIAPSNNFLSICEGTDLTLSGPLSYAEYVWTNDKSTRQISIDQAGEYAVKVTDELGCESEWSDILEIEIKPNPVSTITPDADEETLIASTGDEHQWLFKDSEVDTFQPIVGATDNAITLNFLQYGFYAVDVTVNRCTTRSPQYRFLITEAEQKASADISIYPNPVKDQLTLSTSTAASVKIVDMKGKCVTEQLKTKGEHIVDTRDVEAGIYMLIIKDEKSTRRFKIIKAY